MAEKTDRAGETAPDESKQDTAVPEAGSSRRQLLKALAAGSAAITAVQVLPSEWTKPLVDAVEVPLHAQSSPLLGDRGELADDVPDTGQTADGDPDPDMDGTDGDDDRDGDHDETLGDGVDTFVN